MPYNPDIHHRRSIRLQGWDYSWAGAYFITLCTHNRECLFGDIVDGEMQLSIIGKIVDEEWCRSGEIRREIELDAWVIMPNHVPGIVVITSPDGRGVRLHAPEPQVSRKMGGRPRSLSSFIVGFKSASKIRINNLRDTPRQPVWQRDFYDRIIRNESELNATREYIALNPARWVLDDNNPFA